jgi:phage terminase small subunit
MPPKPKTGLTARQRKFVAEYVVDHNGAAAARRAGYNASTAKEYAYQLLQRPEILAAVREREEGEDRLVGSRRYYVLNRLRDLAERSLQAEPVRDAKGIELGVYKLDGPTAARALELLGKYEGLFNDKLEVRVQGEVERTLEGVRALMSPQSYAELLRAIAEISGVGGVDPPSAAGDRSDAVH